MTAKEFMDAKIPSGQSVAFLTTFEWNDMYLLDREAGGMYLMREVCDGKVEEAENAFCMHGTTFVRGSMFWPFEGLDTNVGSEYMGTTERTVVALWVDTHDAYFPACPNGEDEIRGGHDVAREAATEIRYVAMFLQHSGDNLYTLLFDEQTVLRFKFPIDTVFMRAGDTDCGYIAVLAGNYAWNGEKVCTVDEFWEAVKDYFTPGDEVLEGGLMWLCVDESGTCGDETLLFSDVEQEQHPARCA